MSKSTNRLIARSFGAVLIAVSISFIARLAFQFNSIEKGIIYFSGIGY